jgi:hypothetical protein
MRELWLSKWGAETQRLFSNGIDQDEIRKLKKECQQLRDLRDQHTDHIWAAKSLSEKKVEELNEALATLSI